ncbi:MAG: DUF456 domain-containing protein [Candidatus Omnitrophota bacterium]|jgi:uncharacterized protein YqgC (DUF456 family)
MKIFALTILILFSLTGFVALFFTTFGTLIILIGAVIFALITKLSILTLKTLVILFILYLFGEVLEYVFIISGAKKLGASNAAIAGALVGGIVGAAAGAAAFGVGIFAGAILGIFLGAFLVELFVQKDLVRSLKAGTGGVLGRIGSIATKVIISGVMFYIMFSRIIVSF